MADLQLILSSGDITELRLGAATDGSKVLTSDEIDSAYQAKGGANIMAYVAKVATYVITTSDYTVDCNGTFTVTLPTATSGQIFNIKNSGTGVITVSGTIDGQSSQILSTKENLTVQYTGASYIIL